MKLITKISLICLISAAINSARSQYASPYSQFLQMQMGDFENTDIVVGDNAEDKLEEGYSLDAQEDEDIDYKGELEDETKGKDDEEDKDGEKSKDDEEEKDGKETKQDDFGYYTYEFNPAPIYHQEPEVHGNFRPGDGGGGTEFKIENKNSKEDCLKACY